MKRVLGLLIICVMCISLFSCGENDVPKGMQRASDPKVADYDLFVPENWVVSDSQRATTQAFVSNSDRTNVLVMQWNVTEDTKTVKDWWEKEYKPQVFKSGAIQDVKVENDNGTAMTLDKKSAIKYVYTGKIGDSYFKYEVIGCVANGSIYVMQFTYMQDNLEQGEEITYSTVEKHKEDVNSIIENFRFK